MEPAEDETPVPAPGPGSATGLAGRRRAMDAEERGPPCASAPRTRAGRPPNACWNSGAARRRPRHGSPPGVGPPGRKAFVARLGSGT
eukprot:9827562-Lingulodinium_polyedra.AAC.1